MRNRYLEGPYAPVREEVTATELGVTGRIPTELEGRYLRNGPNPILAVDPETQHWFVGDGMVHGVRLRGGKAEWYRNRYVRSDRVAEALGEKPIGGPVHQMAGGPNTNVIGHAGRTWAIVEAGANPVELTYELESVARNDFFGTVPTGYTAHPKLDPVTGELHAMSYAWPHRPVHYTVIGADGRANKTVEIPTTGMTMVHDMALTERYAVLFDLPCTVDVELAFAGRFPFRWNPDYPARIGLMPRDAGTADAIRWLDVDPCYVFHPLNAYDTETGLVIDLCRYDRMFDQDILGPFGDNFATLDRWTVDLTSGKVASDRIDDRAQEFPRTADSVQSRRHRYGYCADLGLNKDGGGILKYDLVSGSATRHQPGEGKAAGEFVFVPSNAGDGAEDAGWLIGFAHDKANGPSELLIVDAQGMTEVARVALPARVPFGFHGNWVDDTAVPPAG